MNISVGYGEDLGRVFDVINRVGNELAEDPDWESKILKAPQVLRVDSLGDSGIDIKILGETKPMEQWAIMGELRFRLKKVFDEEGIEIPWPHTKVYFGNSLKESIADEIYEKEKLQVSKEKEPKKQVKRRKEEELPYGEDAE
jgi:small-conductance mechanosensitive channel